MPILGLARIDDFVIGDVKLSVNYTLEGSIKFLQLGKERKFIREENKAAHNKKFMPAASDRLI